MSIFGSEKIINMQSPHDKLKIYYAGFDLNDYRYDELVEQILDVLVDFSYGFHQGILEDSYNRRIYKHAAQSIYKIGEFDKARQKYVDEDSEFADDIPDKYLKRGEFGELLLHLLLRDFHNSLPLLSKIYFKDSYGHTVHGFDAVHIAPSIQDSSKFSLWLGESKLYTDGKSGVKELANDILEHFNKEYLRGEFALISKQKDTGYISLDQFKDANKIDEYKEFLEKKDEWLKKIDKTEKLQDILSVVTVPMLCTYSSETFNKHQDEDSKDFLDSLYKEISSLEEHFYTHLTVPLSAELNILLIFFPVPSKKELVKKLHIELGCAQ